ncbi:hypothetical protein BGZ49_009722 [Haplosporangium sp. Z 27]|nr:hypothetical protein BGZ49_009722 [Haplosporangium sp. Z 27]
MGLFSKPLLPAHYENEDVQISAELCSNIAINVVGLAKGEITIIGGNEDMIQIHTSVQAKEALLKNAAALEPTQDGDQYTYTIHTPLDIKLEKSVTFQLFITIPRNLDSLESFKIEGTNVEVSIGNISHTFIKSLEITNTKGDVSIDSFYGESVTISSDLEGNIKGKYSIARLHVNSKNGRIISDVHLLNTDDQQPAPKVICQTTNHRVDVRVDGTDLLGPFSVEAKTQQAPLDVQILLPDDEQRFLGNFINFGGVNRVQLSKNYVGRVETRTHYGKIFLEEPNFVRLKDATLTIPSASDREYYNMLASESVLMGMGSPVGPNGILSSLPFRSPKSQGTAMSWGEDYHPHHHQNNKKSGHQRSRSKKQSSPDSINSSGSSRAESTTGSYMDSMSPPLSPTGLVSDRQRWIEEKDNTHIISRELIGTIGDGPGLVICKNSSEDIYFKLI